MEQERVQTKLQVYDKILEPEVKRVKTEMVKDLKGRIEYKMQTVGKGIG